MSNGVLVCRAVEEGKDFVLIDVNQAGEQIEGFARETLVGKRFTEAFSGVREFDLLDVLQRVWRDGQPRHHSLALYRDGHLSGWRENFVYRLDSGEIIAVYIDLTEQKQAEVAVQLLMESTVGLTGQEYFDNVVAALARWSGADSASIGERVSGNQIRAIAFTLDGNLVRDFHYPLAGSPCAEVIQTGAPKVYPENVCRLFPADQELIELHAQGYAGSPILDRHGEPLGILWMVSRNPLRLPSQWRAIMTLIAARTGAEIERLRAETCLQENMERYRALVETTRDFIWELDANGVYTYCSPQVQEMLGYEPQALIGKTPFSLMPPNEAERMAGIFADLVRRRAPIMALENRNLRQDGREIVLETRGMPIFDELGKLVGYRGIDRDITERKQTERYLRESEQRFRELIEHLPNTPIQGYDQSRRVIYWNEASAKVYGYRAEEALGRQLEDLIIPDAMRAEVVEAVRAWHEEGREIPAGELWLKRKDGSLVPVFSSHVMLRKDTDNPEMFCIDIDLTEQKRAQQELERMARYDWLTDLPNRHLFEREMEKRIVEAERFGQRFAVLFIDLDRFKQVNDTWGHEYGDLLLRQVAERLKVIIRRYDVLARFGGDEFILILSPLGDDREAATLAEKILHEFERRFDLNGHSASVGASIGISRFPDDGRSGGELLQNADIAMYRAKKQGCNRYQFFTQAMNEELRRGQGS